MGGSTTKTSSRLTYLRWSLDIFLYLTILVPLLLSILGYINVDLGSFHCNDPYINLEYRGNTVSRKVMVVLLFVPILFLIFFTEVSQSSLRSVRSVLKEAGHKTLHIYIRYWIGATINILVNDLLKTLSAVPRPHFISTCQPDWTKINCSTNSGIVYFSRSLCLSADTKAVYDAMKSWPSGHAQLTAFSSIFMAVYVEKRIGEKRSLMLKRWIQIVLLIGPVVSSTTRIHDQRHHISDVVVGLVLGGLLGLALANSSIPTDWSQTDQAKVEDPPVKQKRPSRMHLLSHDLDFGSIRETDNELNQVHQV